ncbi:hypothetical protein CALVIDRAFT_275524 [Calocera viscosa TUFC12733]|uniref:Uncharacterized protein n=1 Tax=Calocera viscosa (strain TUFC12733) TaxID=1330018 RepID=A0A167QZW7_CALVF|nr:hypothetical protein CALVIDRAFT_275524 [Calocera viscosa TUFC12733]
MLVLSILAPTGTTKRRASNSAREQCIRRDHGRIVWSAGAHPLLIPLHQGATSRVAQALLYAGTHISSCDMSSHLTLMSHSRRQSGASPRPRTRIIASPPIHRWRCRRDPACRSPYTTTPIIPAMSINPGRVSTSAAITRPFEMQLPYEICPTVLDSLPMPCRR